MGYYNDVITGTMASQITILTIVYSTMYSGADQRKHQSSASLAFVREIHKWPVTRKMFPFDDFIIVCNKVDTASPLNNGSTYIYTNVFTDGHRISLFCQEYYSLSVKHIKLWSPYTITQTWQIEFGCKVNMF